MILVTGAAGFIGREVCRQLLEMGESIIALDRGSDGQRQQNNLGGLELDRLLTIDLLEADLHSLLQESTGVIHLAGSPGVQTSWSTGFGTHLDNNVLVTQRLAEALLDAPEQRMVVASSSSVYGNISNGRASESQPIAPLSPYGASKAAMEHVVSAYVPRGLDIVPLRYFTVYGPHQRPDMAMHLMIEALRGGPSFTVRGDGSQQRNFTYVGDAARATILALKAAATEPGKAINVGGSGTVSVAEVLVELSDIAGRDVPTDTVMPIAGDPQRTAADTTRAKTILGWTPQVSLRHGLEAQVAWQSGQAPAIIDITNSKPQTSIDQIGSGPLASPSGLSVDTH